MGVISGPCSQCIACAPLREKYAFPSENCAPKKATGSSQWGAFAINTFLFLVSTPKCESKIPTKGGFLSPNANVSLKQKLCPKRKQHGRHHWGEFAKTTHFFYLHPRIVGEMRTKGGFYDPNRKPFPK